MPAWNTLERRFKSCVSHATGGRTGLCAGGIPPALSPAAYSGYSCSAARKGGVFREGNAVEPQLNGSALLQWSRN